MSERPGRLSPEYTAWADEKIVSLGRRVADLEAAWIKENNVAGKFEGELQVAEARVAKLLETLTEAEDRLATALVGGICEQCVEVALANIRTVLAKGRAA